MERRPLHFVGIGGIGMSAIARILVARGERVTGCDLADSSLIDGLRAEGVAVSIGHDAAHIGGAGTIVVSAAVDPQNPECVEARRRGIPIVRRGEMLARVMRGARGIAVCGTHGKTTTTAMAAGVLRSGNIDANVVVGGIGYDTESNAHAGAGSWFLTEADESDGSFSLLAPELTVLTNIEDDHVRSEAELPQLIDAFRTFLKRLPESGTAILGADNARSAALAGDVPEARTVTFGFHPGAHVRAVNARTAGVGSSFDVIAGGVCLGNVSLRVPGSFNIRNALGAVALGRALDIPFASIGRALHEFRGVHRRFEILADGAHLTVIDDYAHHPTAVEETIEAARSWHGGHLVVAFQPHRYTRTAFLAQRFAAALGGADTVYLTPIYAAGERSIDGVSETNIGDALRGGGADVRYVAHVDDLRSRILDEAPRGAIVLMLGAGDITRVANALAHDVRSFAA